MTYSRASEGQFSLDEYPTGVLPHEPLVERANVRPNGWGSIQRQESTNPKKEESNKAIFYAALGILVLAISYRMISALTT